MWSVWIATHSAAKDLVSLLLKIVLRPRKHWLSCRDRIREDVSCVLTGTQVWTESQEEETEKELPSEMSLTPSVRTDQEASHQQRIDLHHAHALIKALKFWKIKKKKYFFDTGVAWKTFPCHLKVRYVLVELLGR